MTQTRNGSTGDAQRGTEQEQPTDTETAQGEVAASTSWLANTAVRSGLTLIGLVVLLFALGQAVGIPLLEMATDALTSQTGQWLVVAFFAILLIGAAQKAAPIR